MTQKSKANQYPNSSGTLDCVYSNRPLSLGCLVGVFVFNPPQVSNNGHCFINRCLLRSPRTFLSFHTFLMLLLLSPGFRFLLPGAQWKSVSEQTRRFLWGKCLRFAPAVDHLKLVTENSANDLSSLANHGGSASTAAAAYTFAEPPCEPGGQSSSRAAFRVLFSFGNSR